MNCYCGIDWAEGHHDVAIIDRDGTLVAKKRIGDDPAGFTALIGMLAEVGDSREDPILIAIETPRRLLVAGLRAGRRPVLAINPMAVARYRERSSVAGTKSDHADAMTLANILRVDAHVHRTSARTGIPYVTRHLARRRLNSKGCAANAAVVAKTRASMTGGRRPRRELSTGCERICAAYS